MITFIELKNGALSFLDKELVSKIDNQLTKIGAVSSLYIIDKKATNLFNLIKDHQFIKYLGVIDEQGNIDDELLIDAIRTGMNGKSVSFDTGFLGTITFYPEDLDKLRSHLKAENKTEQIPLI